MNNLFHSRGRPASSAVCAHMLAAHAHLRATAFLSSQIAGSTHAGWDAPENILLALPQTVAGIRPQQAKVCTTLGAGGYTETTPEQHRDRGGVVIGGPRSQPGQAVLSTGELTDLADGLGGQSAAGELLPDPVAELSFAIGNADQVDPARDRAVIRSQNMKAVCASVLIGQQLSMAGRVVGKEVAGWQLPHPLAQSATWVQDEGP